jgi:flagellar motor switch protein FliM
MPADTSPAVHPPQGEVVSQSEVERLLAQIGSGEATETDAPHVSPGAFKSGTGKRHVFPQYSQFSAGPLRKLRVRHENFLRGLAARLSLHLRFELSLQMAGFDTYPFQKFLEGVSQPGHLTLISFEPLEGICLLDIPPRLGLSIVDRQLGGPGSYVEDARDLNQTEIRVLSQIVQIIVSEWCGTWSGLFDIRPVLLGTENSTRYLHTSRPEEIMLVLAIEARLGGLVEQMHLALPHVTLQPLVLKLAAEPGSGGPAGAAKRNTPVQWKPSLGELRMRAAAQLPGLRLSAKALANLQPGEILPVPEKAVGQVSLCLHGVPRFAGVLGTSGSHWALEIQRVINPEKDL